MVILTHEKLKHLCESISLNNNTLKQKDLHYPNVDFGRNVSRFRYQFQPNIELQLRYL